MRKVTRELLLLISLTIGAGAISPIAAGAAGPLKAQVLDAETGQPLEGVVILAYWIKYTASWAGWAGGEFYDAEEVVTGLDGRFVVSARSTFTLLPWRKISRELVIFKPGYGQWRFQGYETWRKLPLEEHDARVEAAWKQFAGEGVVMELPPLKTREERLRFVEYRVDWAPVPFERAARLRQAKDEERAYLGLPKIYERKP